MCPVLVADSHCRCYCSFWKSTDLMQLENAYQYFSTKSLFVVGQVPLLVFILCFKVFLCVSSILQLYIKCADVWAPSLQGHVGLSANLNLCRYDFVIPWPETIAVNSGVNGIFSFSLCSTVGMKDVHWAPLWVLSHCLCHFVNPAFFVCVCWNLSAQ